jgi:hypothetical protein
MAKSSMFGWGGAQEVIYRCSVFAGSDESGGRDLNHGGIPMFVWAYHFDKSPYSLFQ